MAMPEEPDLTAAELALGVLEGEERAAALRRVLANPAFAREVERWRDHFAALHAEWPEAEPGADAARRIATIPDGDVPTPPRRGRPMRWVGAAAAVAATAVLALTLVRQPQFPAGRPPAARAAPIMVAVLKPEDGDAFSVLFDPALREVRLGGAVSVPPGRDAELWIIGADGVPHAAGLMLRPASRHVRIAPGLAVVPGVTLAISIEPTGGSPKPTPTGPVVATGKLVPI